MPKTTRGWPPERRQAQAERIRQTRPWTRSTGPKTEDGKAVSARNGITHGLHTPEAQHLREALKAQCRIVTVLEMIEKNRNPN